MLPGTLSADHVRETYLRGIVLGSAWYGPSADAAIEALLAQQLALAEARMSIQWQRWRVVTDPEAGLVEGQDYDIAGRLLPYMPPVPPEAPAYRLIPGYTDVQAVTRVRLLRADLTYETLPIAAVVYNFADEHLYVPVALVSAPATVLGWALDFTFGVGRLPREIAAWVELGAAIEVLSLASVGAEVGAGGGAAETTLVMDGTEERIRAGGGSSDAGIYGPAMRGLQRQRDAINLTALRFRYQGSKFLLASG
jgi:hypothetical protein